MGNSWRENLASEVVRMASAAGASDAEVVIQDGSEFSSTVRLGSLEKLVQADFRRLGLRVYQGARSAITATSDFSKESLRKTVRETLEMARAASEDGAAGLPEAEAYRYPDSKLELSFPETAASDVRDKIERTRRCEAAALETDARITNSEGARFEDTLTHNTYANSHGFCRTYPKTRSSLSATPLAESGGLKQRDYWMSAHLNPSKMQSPEEIGRIAAERALRRLGARKVSTCRVPVILDPLSAAAILREIAQAASGNALRRKASFLLDRLGVKISSPLVTVYDDAIRPNGLATRPFDAEGRRSEKTLVIREGVMESYLLDEYSARKLGLKSTGNSDREVHGGPSAGPSNFYLCPGNDDPGDIIASVKEGLYVTELIGFGVNLVSGNYSQGAVGQWIRNGNLEFPVEEVTIAGNLNEMLMGIEAVGNDLMPLGEVFSPTILIDKMVVSGD
jgi:PmbA protein